MTRTARIFYYCSYSKEPKGGSKRIYNHVDILNESGHEAYVVQETDRRFTWFANNTQVIGPSRFFDLWDANYDFLVVPGELGQSLPLFPGRKIAFDMNMAGLHCPYSPREYHYLHEDVIGVMAVSDHNQRHLQLALPGISIVKVATGVNPLIFAFRPLLSKKKQFAFAGKHVSRVELLRHMLLSRAKLGLNKANEYVFVSIAKMPEPEVARILGNSLGLLSLSVEEGLPQLPLEAMLSGCLIAGYQIGPLREYPPFTYQCEYGELTGMVAFLEQLMEGFPSKAQPWADKADALYKQAQAYGGNSERVSVLAAWEMFLRTPARLQTGQKNPPEARPAMIDQAL